MNRMLDDAYAASSVGVKAAVQSLLNYRFLVACLRWVYDRDVTPPAGAKRGKQPSVACPWHFHLYPSLCAHPFSFLPLHASTLPRLPRFRDPHRKKAKTNVVSHSAFPIACTTSRKISIKLDLSG